MFETFTLLLCTRHGLHYIHALPAEPFCLDLVPNMNSASFIRSFKRFSSRYGCPDNVISDNGSNFVSADSRNFVASRFIKLQLNLPLAPWYGVFFERLLKRVKYLLIKDLKGSRLSYEEMQTVLFECEAILNKCPLTYIYPTDLIPCLHLIICFMVV